VGKDESGSPSVILSELTCERGRVKKELKLALHMEKGVRTKEGKGF
jgi:hypothetical protein